MANHITFLRRNAGFRTGQKAAKKLNISPAMMYQMEACVASKQIRRPGSALAFRMTRLFNCSFDDIFMPFFITSCNNSSGNHKNEGGECK